MDPTKRPTDDEHVTLRAPRWLFALAIALGVHVGALVIASLLPEVKPAPKRIEMTFATAPAAQTSPPPPAPAKARPKKRAAPPPSTSPVLPELPPSEESERAELPVVERAPEPAPPPEPSSWKDRLQQQLANTGPSAKMATGALAPSFGTLDRVAAADASLHDEQTERRMMEDFGPFFRRGLEALRANWHPDEVLRATERDPSRRCGHSNRTTYAVAVLDRQGRVVDVDLKNPSGCDDLDEEAVAAFKRVAHFPHPPAGIFVGPDGEQRDTARYPVRFIVTFDGGIQLDWSSG